MLGGVDSGPAAAATAAASTLTTAVAAATTVATTVAAATLGLIPRGDLRRTRGWLRRHRFRPTRL